MVRVLVTVTPCMYREAIALSIQRNRPDLDVRVAPPEAAEEQLATFQPHLLVHNDTTPISAGALEGVPSRVEVLYSDSMNARLYADGQATEARDASTEDLLGTVDRAVAVAGQEDGQAGASRGRAARRPTNPPE